MPKNQRRILLTGGRSTIALDLARYFHSHGEQVFVADSHKIHICRFSNTVKKNFQVPSPRFQPIAFIESLIDIIKKYEIDMLIPTCEETIYISRGIDEFPAGCEVFCEPFDIVNSLHSKWLFMQKVKELGFNAPDTYLVQSQEDLENLNLPFTYALKATYSRACQNMIKVSPEDPVPKLKINPNNPWIAQKWVKGNQFCSYSIVKKGHIYAHSLYPVRFTVEGSSCITFEAVRHEKIFEWVKRFCQLTQYTGQLAFDFIENKDGELFAIECNPRATHGLHLFSDEDQIPLAFYGENKTLIQPKEETLKQIAMGMMAFGWRSINRKPQLPAFLHKFFGAKDVVFSKKDIKPFFFMALLFPMYWYMAKKKGLTIPALFIYDMEWNGEPFPIKPKEQVEYNTNQTLNMV